ncbi:hypothetical protein B0T24DRAFT_631312 [Lasiosphaeria ovina]|uniref:RRN7-type domain-containing protein n=1 Tax=Lasiosphaeria ovina TaxID=92902 RepID=A0AAE0K3M4_9PEZI|nr:hypothetical protein B0T24DRAFT_631312 [Lasiosphaeria ovina]
MADRRHHRFPRGEHCADCPARRWYLENGRRYCENGHQVEGYVQFDVDDEDNYNRTGRVSRKQKDIREAERKHLSGNQARGLYLACLGFIIRKQVAWLVKKKGLHPELESVCCDLWILRIRDFPGLAKDSGKSSHGNTPPPHPGPDGELAMFSSQVELPPNAPDVPPSNFRKGPKSWFTEDWALPGAIDTLALVYLGCLLRQEPVRVGDLYRWAKTNQIPFIGAIDLLPQDWRERLPGWAQKSLLTRYIKFQGSELHRAIIDLIRGYKENRCLEFPAVPAQPSLLLYLKDLALPPDVYTTVQDTCSLLDTRFSFPARGPDVKSHMLLDMPDVLLVAAIVSTAKLLYPMDGKEQFSLDDGDLQTLQMNWEVWEAEFITPPKKLGSFEFEKLGPNDIWDLSKQELHEFMNWFQITQLDEKQTDEMEIERIFPLEAIQPLPEFQDMTDEEVEARMKRVQKAMTIVPPRPDREGETKPEIRLYRYPSSLKGHAKRFYEVAAEVSGLTLKDLVFVVYSFDQLLLRRQIKELRRLKKEATRREKQIKSESKA